MMILVAYPKKETAPFFEFTCECFSSSTENVPISSFKWTAESLLTADYDHIPGQTLGGDPKDCLKHC